MTGSRTAPLPVGRERRPGRRVLRRPAGLVARGAAFRVLPRPKLVVRGLFAAAAAAVVAVPVNGLAAAPPPAAQAQPTRVEGRVVDQGTGESVEGAEVVVRAAGDSVGPDSAAGDSVAGDSMQAAAGAVADPPAAGDVVWRVVTDGAGLFVLDGIAPGDYRLSVTHIAYGAFTERISVRADEQLALRIRLSLTAIEVEPITVAVSSFGDRRRRAMGTAARRLTAAQLEPVARTGDHLANALARLVPGMRAQSGRSQSGELVCLEFRDPASLAGGGCRTPVVVVDNVRQANGLVTLNTLPVSNIRSVEALGPAEAGVRFGAEGNHGAILIETMAGGPLRTSPDPDPLAVRPATYSWALESEPYPWGRTLALAAAANAAGLLAGYAVSRHCLGFDNLSQHFVDGRCGFFGNAGSRMLLYMAPHAGAGYVARRVGATDLSEGSGWKNALAGAVLGLPGIVLAISNDDDGFAVSKEVGFALAIAAAPAAAVAADRLFRKVRR